MNWATTRVAPTSVVIRPQGTPLRMLIRRHAIIGLTCRKDLFFLPKPILNKFTLTDGQLALLDQPLDTKVFLEGPYGAGKTSAAVARLLTMLDAGVRGDQVLLMVPQRTLAAPYYEALPRAGDCPRRGGYGADRRRPGAPGD